MYGLTQQDEISQNNSVKSIESDYRQSNNVWNHTEIQGIFVNDSVESDSRDKSDVNETDYQ